MKYGTLPLLFLLFLGRFSAAQTPSIQRVNPTNWYVGMRNPALQLLIHGKDLKGSQVAINYPGVTVQKVHEVENPNYLFVDLLIAPEARAGAR